MLHIERTGLITEKDAEEMLEEYHEVVGSVFRCSSGEGRSFFGGASVALRGSLLTTALCRRVASSSVRRLPLVLVQTNAP